MNKSKELRTAIAAAEAAGKIIMNHYGNVCCIREKSARLGVVTEVDLKAQKKIKSVITKAFPKAEFLAEEDKEHPKVSNLMWIVDPLDGTKNFTRGIKSFSVSIALLREKKLVLGVVLDPAANDLFYAEKGKGAFLNNKRIKVSNVSKSEAGIFSMALPRRARTRNRNYSFYKKLFKTMGSMRNLGSAALQISMVAAGRFDAYIEYGLYPWDSAGGLAILKEAGGKATDAKGKPFGIFAKTALIATNGKLHNQIIKELNK